MKKDKTDKDFYKRMLEAKKRKKEALEQRQLHAEFEAHPELYRPELPPIIVKSEAEQKLDNAFAELQAKLKATQQPTQQERIAQAFDDIARKAAGL